ncbi:hypothetical protein E2K93_02800 [Thalassotalea sp. HSM 43]|uniref:Calx-beta domain-containing protein n=1 Tax=Thalassotalea sp. HSM 43 TaxID=2552945 RepID=UPI0010812B5A|nr:Calx-beta domain-containing protein [Thalassotalea sp. HSM 43]QBY03364.1 hypothetical protein E2K93_02800 [Thalassotalea sp. HSM 43]
MMNYKKLTGIALSVAFAMHSGTALANSSDDAEYKFPEQNYNHVGEDQFSDPVFTDAGILPSNGDADSELENPFELLTAAYDLFNEHVVAGADLLTFSVDGEQFSFNTRTEYKYGLLHLYGENEQGHFLRLIRGDDTRWFGDVSNGVNAYTLMPHVAVGGSAWFTADWRIPNKGELLVNGAEPVAADPLTSLNVDVGYVYTHLLEATYGRLGMRASILYSHYQVQDILDNSGINFYLNPVFIERQDARFFDQGTNSRDYIAGREFMFGDLEGAENLREYLMDFGVDYVGSWIAGAGFFCGILRQEYELDDIGLPKFVLDDEEERADTLYGTLLGGNKQSCRNTFTSRWFFIHNMARAHRQYYKDNPVLPANRRMDFGGISDYAHASSCNGHPTIMNTYYGHDNYPLPVLSSPTVTYKGEACGDERNNNVKVVSETLPGMANNGQRPETSSVVSFKSVINLANESQQWATVTLVRDGDISESASVEVAAISKGNPGSAVAGVDFAQGFPRAEFAAGEKEAEVKVRIIDNDVYRKNATIDLALNFAKRLTVESGTVSKLIIQDNDSEQPGRFDFASDSIVVNESDQAAVIELTRSGDFVGSQMIRYNVVEGTAKEGSDFVGDSGYVVFGENDSSKMIEIELIGDDYQNATNRNFYVEISSDVDGDLQRTEVVIGDDEAASGRVALRSAVVDVDYHASSANITLTRDDASQGEILVHFETFDDTALAGTHYVHTNDSVKFLAGETEKTISIRRLRKGEASEQNSFTVVFDSPMLDGEKVVTVNLMAQPEREESSSGGALGLCFAPLLLLLARRRCYR